MASYKTNLAIDEELHTLFLQLQESFNNLNKTDKWRFGRRNGFDLSGYKNFVETAIMVMIMFGKTTGDIRVIDGKYIIDANNLTKRTSLPTKKSVALPWEWEDIYDWTRKEYEWVR